MSENIVLLGVLFLGGFVGLLLGLTIRFAQNPTLKFVIGIIGAALGGAPVLFMGGLEHQKWTYPVGLVVGLLWIRVLNARTIVATRPKKSERPAWYLAWADTLAVLTVTTIIVVSAAFVDMRKAATDDDAVRVTRQMILVAGLGCASVGTARRECDTNSAKAFATSLRAPVPTVCDELILTREFTLIVSNYTAAAAPNKCDFILEPPWEYRPETAARFEAGRLPAASLVTVNQVNLQPSASAEPAYVWALIGPR